MWISCEDPGEVGEWREGLRFGVLGEGDEWPGGSEL